MPFYKLKTGRRVLLLFRRRGRGSPRRQEGGGGRFLIENPRGGGGSPRRGGGGAWRVSVVGDLGGGLNIFVRGRASHQVPHHGSQNYYKKPFTNRVLEAIDSVITTETLCMLTTKMAKVLHH